VGGIEHTDRTRVKLEDKALFRVDADTVAGGEPRELLRFEKEEEMWLVGVAWTPDGQYVLFPKWLMGGKGGELWRISAEGGEPQKLWEWKKGFFAPRVHPDGQRIVFYTHSYTSEVWVMENFLPAGE